MPLNPTLWKKVLELISACSLQATEDESRAVQRAWMSDNDSCLLSLNFSFRITLFKNSFQSLECRWNYFPASLSENTAKSMTCSPRTVLTLETVDEILWYHHSNNPSSVVLSYGTNYLVCSPNFSGCGWNLMVLPIPITPFWQYFHIVLHNYLVCGSKRLSPWKKSYIQKTSFLCHGLVPFVFRYFTWDMPDTVTWTQKLLCLCLFLSLLSSCLSEYHFRYHLHVLFLYLLSAKRAS